MQIDSSIFKAYDIRGVYPTSLNQETIVPIIRAIYTFFKKEISSERPLTVVLGKDMRISSPQLFDIAKKELVAMGAHVIDVGLVSTPTFYFSVFYYNYDCGIQITASHNPKEWNGIKFVKNSPKGLIKIGRSTGMEEIKKMALEGKSDANETGGTVEEKKNVLDDEVKNALKVLNNPKFKKFKVVADPANAMGITYLSALENHVSIDLVKMNFELDGTFPAHQPDPLDFKNLVDLQKKVVEEKADFGLAPDGDGDRLFFIDEKGQVIPASLITALIAKEFLRISPNDTVLYDIRYILTPKKVIEENGGKSEITKVGHAFITEKLTQTGGIFAGESSAHYFYKATGNAESQVLTILTVMDVLSREQKPLSEVVKILRRSYESGEINFKVSNAPEILATLKETYKDGALSELDGVSIEYPTWRFNVRTSNTEPLLRLNVESLERDTMESKKEELKNLIEEKSQ